MTLTDIWIRVMESGAKGCAYVVFAWFILYLLLDKRCGQRKTLLLIAVAWLIVGAGSINTALSIYLIRPTWIAFGNIVPAVVLLVLAAWLVGKSTELREAWVLWSELIECAEKQGKSEVQIRIRKASEGLWARLARKRSKDAIATGAVGSSRT